MAKNNVNPVAHCIQFLFYLVLYLIVRLFIRPPTPPLAQSVILIYAVCTANHDTLIAVKLVNFTIYCKKNIRKIFFIENQTAVIFAFPIRKNGLWPCLVITMYAKQSDGKSAGIS